MNTYREVCTRKQARVDALETRVAELEEWVDFWKRMARRILRRWRGE